MKKSCPKSTISRLLLNFDMNDFDRLLAEVSEQARKVKIPVSKNISPQVIVNSRATKRFGQCIFKNGIYTIELSQRLKNAPEKSCRQTIAHELIHTCKGCNNHGKKFLHYAEIMNREYGYNIKRTSSCEELGVEDISNVRYILVCEKCGAEIKRSRYTKVIANPSEYKCICGGKLRRIQ